LVVAAYQGTAGAQRVADGPQIAQHLVCRSHEGVDRVDDGYLCHALATGLLSWREYLV
jgi:hypothetical protein